MKRRPFVRPVDKTGWYFSHPRYLRYMSREVTCLFIGAFALLMLYAVQRLARGPADYATFLTALQSPWGIAGLISVLLFAVHNTISWFNVTPKALPVQIGEEFLPGKYIVAAHYALWVVATLAVLYFAGVL